MASRSFLPHLLLSLLLLLPFSHAYGPQLDFFPRITRTPTHTHIRPKTINNNPNTLNTGIPIPKGVWFEPRPLPSPLTFTVCHLGINDKPKLRKDLHLSLTPNHCFLITGNTHPHTHIFQDLGGVYSNVLKGWLFHPYTPEVTHTQSLFAYLTRLDPKHVNIIDVEFENGGLYFRFIDDGRVLVWARGVFQNSAEDLPPCYLDRFFERL